jgi:hypothetical protein
VVDFTTATVDPLVAPDPATAAHRLTVTGVLAAPAKVTLVPRVYVRQPEHWGIEVTACPVPVTTTTTVGDLTPAPVFRLFRTSLDFRGPFGTCGIEVIGATKSEKFDLGGPGCAALGPVT